MIRNSNLNSPNSSPQVSVITPCFNQAEYLAECLESLLQQTFQDWVCVVMDDGSTDHSINLAQDYSNKDARIHSARQPNQGPAAARNHAIQLCQSEYILPLDADDRIDPTFMEKVVKAAHDHPTARVIYTRCKYFGSLEKEMDLKDYSFKELLHGNIIPVTGLYRRVDFLKTPGYDIQMRDGWEDWDFWLSLLGSDDEVFKLEETLFFYRRKENSRNNSVSPQKACTLRKYIYQKHFEIYRHHFEDPINLAHNIKLLEKQVRALKKKDLLGRAERKLAATFGRLLGKSG